MIIVLNSFIFQVLNEGQIVEFDVPQRLLQNENGYFSQLVFQCNWNEISRECENKTLLSAPASERSVTRVILKESKGLGTTKRRKRTISNNEDSTGAYFNESFSLE